MLLAQCLILISTVAVVSSPKQHNTHYTTHYKNKHTQIAADNAVFGQTGPKVGSFDAGYGSTHMAAIVGQKKAREMWFLSRLYGAAEAERMGLVNKVVPLADLEAETLAWCRQILSNSPTALRVLKSAMNAAEDGQAGIQQLAGDATMLFYMSEEGGEGHRAYVEKRRPDWGRFPRLP